MLGLPDAASAGSVSGVGVAVDWLALPPALLVRARVRARARARARARVRARARARARVRARAKG